MNDSQIDGSNETDATINNSLQDTSGIADESSTFQPVAEVEKVEKPCIVRGRGRGRGRGNRARRGSRA